MRTVTDSSEPALRRWSVNGLWHYRRGGGSGWAEPARPRGGPPAFHSFCWPLLTSLSHALYRGLGIPWTGPFFQELPRVARGLWDTREPSACPHGRIPEKMSFSFMMLTSRLVRRTAALSMICSGL